MGRIERREVRVLASGGEGINAAVTQVGGGRGGAFEAQRGAGLPLLGAYQRASFGQIVARIPFGVRLVTWQQEAPPIGPCMTTRLGQPQRGRGRHSASVELYGPLVLRNVRVIEKDPGVHVHVVRLHVHTAGNKEGGSKVAFCIVFSLRQSPVGLRRFPFVVWLLPIPEGCLSPPLLPHVATASFRGGIGIWRRHHHCPPLFSHPLWGGSAP